MKHAGHVSRHGIDRNGKPLRTGKMADAFSRAPAKELLPEQAGEPTHLP